MKKLLRQFHYGEKGFTLIELLIVVAILGVLAAVIIPNVSKFMGRGTLEAANTEATMVETAVAAAMMDAGASKLDTGGYVGPGTADNVTAAGASVNVTGYCSGQLQAVYNLDTDGSISSANATGKWKDLVYTKGIGWHEPP